MKVFLLLVTTLCLFTFCAEKKDQDKLTQSNFEIAYYRIPWDDGKTREIVELDKRETVDSTSFVYKYKRYTKENHRLVIYKDSLTFQGVKLKHIQSKKFKIKDISIEINKYLCYADAFTFNIYIEKSRGIVAFRNVLKNNVMEYHTDKEIEDIDNNIVSDSLFFKRVYQ